MNIDSWKVWVNFIGNTDQVDHNTDPVDFSAHLPGHGVRIPALMVYRSVDTIPISWQNLPMREEPKQHVFFDAQHHNLMMVSLYWQEYRRSRLTEPLRLGLRLTFSPISSLNVVYPCFRQVNGCPEAEIVFGVCFCPRTRTAANTRMTYTRTYLRFGLEDNQSDGAFDITQDFINENANPKDVMAHYKNSILFQNLQVYNCYNSIAFYVCRGARLVVND